MESEGKEPRVFGTYRAEIKTASRNSINRLVGQNTNFNYHRH